MGTAEPSQTVPPQTVKILGVELGTARSPDVLGVVERLLSLQERTANLIDRMLTMIEKQTQALVGVMDEADRLSARVGMLETNPHPPA